MTLDPDLLGELSNVIEKYMGENVCTEDGNALVQLAGEVIEVAYDDV